MPSIIFKPTENLEFLTCRSEFFDFLIFEFADLNNFIIILKLTLGIVYKRFSVNILDNIN